MKIKPFLALCRISNLPTVWMNVLTTMVLIDLAIPNTVQWCWLPVLALALSAFYCGGMVLNDLCDYQWDKQHQPYRPLVTGSVSVKTAVIIASVLFLTGFVIVALAPFKLAGLLAAAALFVTIAVYDLFHKKTAASIAVMGLARALVFVVVLMALTAQWLHWVLIAAALQFAYTLLLTFVARYEHMRGKPYNGPVIPRMIAGMAIVDGTLLAIVAAPLWLLAGIALAVLTRFGQRYVRGD
ncbi:MAG: UbiA family prenyltransferase [Cellvibrio sp.]|uniref:UbiA family prenyltransferase n=1 Tax=Cellvibrio sp. TaxID=1965322 RepID=UPI0027199D2A|nr:UbiA family prenyltransferase [Cellvibrio sp.]